MKFRTRAIHLGFDPDPQTGAVVPPIHLATTYVQPAAGEWREFDYSRSGNPTRKAFENAIAALESGVGGLAFASGMAAIHCVTQLLETGDHIVTGQDVYGGTFRLFHKIINRAGISVTMVPTNDLEAVEKAFRPNTRLLWLETPGNPLLSITDIAACAKIAHRHGALVGVDSTFATPALTRPLELGADIVMHSATKYLGGHSDVLGGVLVARDEELYQRLYFIQNATGAVMGPWESYLCHRGLRTLELRIHEQCRSAMAVAQFLAEHPAVRRVYYPGLPDHPGHDIAARQMSGYFGAMLSFEVQGDLETAKKVVNSTRLFHLAVSLGAVESLIEQPALMSHASYDPEARRAHGISDTLIRLSIGLEDPEDLIADLEQALARAV
ncbi:MAG: PLP-dependent transferase [Thermogutta sp.]|uniref:trans-sulfuration enzyme family protein n=1 Tax=Thermogutta sp. TaxID=1962930 RepID=UPI0019990CE7|nr:PLP-dependent aspartate aminotransferase family protein [Thermogutta sp.]MBC7353437.1 PLP-dependent transferase [Thermogutta sp.]